MWHLFQLKTLISVLIQILLVPFYRKSAGFFFVLLALAVAVLVFHHFENVALPFQKNLPVSLFNWLFKAVRTLFYCYCLKRVYSIMTTGEYKIKVNRYGSMGRIGILSFLLIYRFMVCFRVFFIFLFHPSAVFSHYRSVISYNSSNYPLN